MSEHEWVTRRLTPEDWTEECINCRQSRLFAEGRSCRGYRTDDLVCPVCYHPHLDYLDEEPCVSCGCERP